MGAQGKIFISYRREDVPGDARGICDRLGRSFGEANVFMDVDRLKAGQRFDRELEKALSRCDVLIAVIGTRWMELLSEHAGGGKRDFVRDEIAAALKRDIVVIPVMTGREAHMPALPLAEDLPQEIRDPVLYQKQNIAHETFGRDAAELIAAIKKVLADRRGPRPWRTIAATVATMLVLTVVSVGYWAGMFPGVGPTVHRDLAKIAAISNSNTDRATAVESAQKTAATEAAARKAAEELSRKVAEGSKQQVADAAARKKANDDDMAAKRAAADCDRLAASPNDASRPNGVVGVWEFSKIDSAATAACDDAMRSNPEVARFVFQAGRAALARKDYSRAAELFRAASTKGYVSAFNGLGVIYTNGFGIAQDCAEARNWFEKGVARGDSSAMTNLGTLYENGRGVAQDYGEARRLYEKAAALDEAFAMYDLGRLYEMGRGVTQDYVEARKWYEQSARLGQAVAMRNLGLFYETGRGVTKDYTEARYWYEKAATLGDPVATNNLATFYYQGLSVSQDYAVARAWYETAATFGNSTAMYNLGVIYENGHGVVTDQNQALKWFQKAADGGNENAKTRLKNLK